MRQNVSNDVSKDQSMRNYDEIKQCRKVSLSGKQNAVIMQ